MPKWSEYPEKTSIADDDTAMIYDSKTSSNKKTLISRIWYYIKSKIMTEFFDSLQTNQKTIVGAINEIKGDSEVFVTEFSDAWIPGYQIDGMGFVVIIPKLKKSNTLKVTSAKVYTQTAWYDATVTSVNILLNHWRVILNVNSKAPTENGKVYLVSLNGEIS